MCFLFSEYYVDILDELEASVKRLAASPAMFQDAVVRCVPSAGVKGTVWHLVCSVIQADATEHLVIRVADEAALAGTLCCPPEYVGCPCGVLCCAPC